MRRGRYGRHRPSQRSADTRRYTFPQSHSGMVDQFRVGIPPFCSAGIRAKHPGFLPRSLNQGCATVLTYLFNTARVLGSNYATQGISLAVGFYGIYGQLHYLSNLFIAISLLTVSCQRPSFISGHVISSSLRRVAPQCLIETRSAFWRDIGNPSKKKKAHRTEMARWA